MYYIAKIRWIKHLLVLISHFFPVSFLMRCCKLKSKWKWRALKPNCLYNENGLNGKRRRTFKPLGDICLQVPTSPDNPRYPTIPKHNTVLTFKNLTATIVKSFQVPEPDWKNTRYYQSEGKNTNNFLETHSKNLQREPETLLRELQRTNTSCVYELDDKNQTLNIYTSGTF